MSAGPRGQGVSFSASQLRRVRDLLTRLYAARRTARFYPADHQATVAGVAELKAVIERFHQEGVDIALTFHEGELIFGDQIMPQESILFDQLIREMGSLGIGSLELVRGLSAAELTRAMSVLATDPLEVERRGGIARLAEEADLKHVRIGKVRAIERAPAEGDEAERAQAAYRGAIDLMREIDELVRRNREIGTARIRGVVRGLTESVLENRGAMLELTGLKDHDEYTFYHSANVSILSLALGSTITDDPRFLASLGVGSLLHDVGKMTIEPEVLNKPGALTPEEWAEIRQHPVSGARTVARIPGLDMSAIVVVLEHHMRYDGSGYPERTPRSPQHLASRIVAVADAYDAMTSRRSYSAARMHDEAMELLVKGAGTALDPALVRLFVNMMGVYPPRSVVRLSDGATAVVARPGAGDPLRPVVRVVSTPAGEMVEPYRLDLAEEGAPQIARTVDPTDLNIDIDEYLRERDVALRGETTPS